MTPGNFEMTEIILRRHASRRKAHLLLSNPPAIQVTLISPQETLAPEPTDTSEVVASTFTPEE